MLVPTVVRRSQCSEFHLGNKIPTFEATTYRISSNYPHGIFKYPKTLGVYKKGVSESRVLDFRINNFLAWFCYIQYQIGNVLPNSNGVSVAFLLLQIEHNKANKALFYSTLQHMQVHFLQEF